MKQGLLDATIINAVDATPLPMTVINGKSCVIASSGTKYLVQIQPHDDEKTHRSLPETFLVKLYIDGVGALHIGFSQKHKGSNGQYEPCCYKGFIHDGKQ
jgi:hypothetical protein